MKGRFRIVTLGCKVNQYESQLMREGLMRAGYRENNGCAAQPDDAKVDICIVNTCTVTKKADAESMGIVRKMTKFYPGAKVVVAGCSVEESGEEIPWTPNVTVLKNHQKNRIAALLSAGGEEVTKITGFSTRSRAYIKVQDGCDYACAFCKIRIVRRASRSRPMKDIIDEARGLLLAGFKELVLVGICLGAYGKDRCEGSLCDLIEALERLEGEFRLRLSSIELVDVTERLIGLFSGSGKLCPHLHIPLQSGDDEILKRMNRRYTFAQYMEIIERLKKTSGDFSVTTDVIAGFPGERDAQFENTACAIEKIKPLGVHVFPFSAREKTPAFAMDDKVSHAEIRRRVSHLKGSASRISAEYKRGFLRKKLRVLAETKERGGLLAGHSDNYLKAAFSGPDSLLGGFAAVTLETLRGERLEGRI